MKKASVLCLLVLISLFISCKAERTNPVEVEIGDVFNETVNEISDIYFEIADKGRTSTEILLLLHNDSNYTITYGMDYEYQIEQNGEWHKIMFYRNDGAIMGVPAIRMILHEKEISEIPITITYLPDGKYRIALQVRKQEDSLGDAESGNLYYITTEFEIAS